MKLKILTLTLLFAVFITMNNKASACLYGGGFTAFTYNDSIGCKTRFTADTPINNNLNYFWDFGDGATSTDATAWHRYANPGTYYVTLIVNGYGCADTVTQSVYVRPCDSCELDASFTVKDTVYCQKVFYPNTIENYEYTYSWDFGDGTTSTDMIPWHEYQSPGSYNVTAVISSNFCVDTVTQTITVLPCDSCNLDASFWYGDSSCYKFFVPYGYNNNPNAQYEWDFGDGTTSTDAYPEHEFNTPGTYLVSLSVDDGTCLDSTMQIVEVLPCNTDSCDIDVSFNYMQDSVECLKVIFHSPSNTTINTQYLWDFGDNTTYSSTGTSSYIQNTYDHTGTYEVTLYMTQGNCTDSLTQIIDLDSCTSSPCNINASFYYFDDTLDCLNVSFRSGLTLTNNSYTWDFGDNTTYTSTGTNSSIQHAYNQPGTYTVTLHMTSGNCQDSTVQTVVVEPCATDSCDLDTGFSATENGQNTYDFAPTSYDSNNNYLWVFGDGTTSTDTYPTHQFPEEGDYYVTLVVSNCTCSTSSTEEIHVSDSTSCPFDAGFTYSVDSSGLYTFTPNYQSSNYSYDWDFGDGTISSTMSPSYTYSSNGTFTVSLSVWETNGGWSCVDTTEQIITVSNATACNQNIGIQYDWTASGGNIHFSPEFYNSNFNYYWDFGDGSTSNWHSPNHTYTSNGNYTVTLQVTTDSNCVVVDTINLNVQTAGIDAQDSPSSEVSIFPNPAKDVVYLNFSIVRDGSYNVIMIDAIGQLVRQKEMQLFKGENRKEINLNSLSKGMYQIQIRDEEGELIKISKLLKQ